MLFAIQPPDVILCYPFRYISERTGKWVRARYMAELHEIAARHTQWEIDGPPEIRRARGIGEYFQPGTNEATHTPGKPVTPPKDPPVKEPPPEHEPELDTLERLLVRYFLRRYATWCSRTRRFGSAEGAAQLYRAVRYASK